MIEGCRVKRRPHDRRARQPGYPSTPASCLPACPTPGAAYGQKGPRPLLAARGGARPRLAACGRRDGARGVVCSGDARSRHYDPHRQARIQLGPEWAVSLQPQPWLCGLGNDLCWDSRSSECVVAILLLPLVLYLIQREVIEREERYLERTFGEEYLNYKTRVRRWV